MTVATFLLLVVHVTDLFDALDGVILAVNFTFLPAATFVEIPVTEILLTFTASVVCAGCCVVGVVGFGASVVGFSGVVGFGASVVGSSGLDGLLLSSPPAASVTVTLQVAFRPFVVVAVISAVPTLSPETTPSVVTYATSGSEDFHFTYFDVASSGLHVAISFSLFPSFKVNSVLFNVILVTGIFSITFTGILIVAASSSSLSLIRILVVFSSCPSFPVNTHLYSPPLSSSTYFLSTVATDGSSTLTSSSYEIIPSGFTRFIISSPAPTLISLLSTNDILFSKETDVSSRFK